MQPIMILMLIGAFAHSTFMVSWVASNQEIYVIFVMAVVFAFTNSLATSQVRGKEMNIRFFEVFFKFLYFKKIKVFLVYTFLITIQPTVQR